MVPYLSNQPQHFYGALIIAVYGGEPEFSKVQIAEHALIDDNERSSYGFGLLRFDGSQQYFALDGQHRLKSIQLALEAKPELGSEEVTVIIVKHENTLEGMERTRRLFSTLNRRAEKTSVGLNIAIDEDDPIAITTRRLVREHVYLSELKLVKANKEGLNSKRLSTATADKPYLTTLQTLYECNEMMMRAYSGGTTIDASFKSNRPDEETLDEYYTYLGSIWKDIIEISPDLQSVRDGRQKAGDLRLDKRSGGGGSVMARPMGQLIVAEVLMLALLRGQEQTPFLRRLLTETSFNLDDAPWRKLIWNPDSRDMIGGKAERTLIVRLLLHKFALALPSGIKPTQLRDEYRQRTQDRSVKLLRTTSVSGAEIESAEGDTDSNDAE
jgi:DNA sulfur modification protein DndB